MNADYLLLLMAVLFFFVVWLINGLALIAMFIFFRKKIAYLSVRNLQDLAEKTKNAKAKTGQ